MNTNGYTQAQQLLAESFQALRKVYDDYKADIRSASQPRGIGEALRGWLAGSRLTQADTRGMAFYDQVAEAVSGLEKALAACAEELADLRFHYAKEAAELMLVWHPDEQPRDIKWYLLAAESHLIPLLPYLKKEELADLRTRYLAATPRRLMFPNQRKLLDQMEQLLADAATIK